MPNVCQVFPILFGKLKVMVDIPQGFISVAMLSMKGPRMRFFLPKSWVIKWLITNHSASHHRKTVSFRDIETLLLYTCFEPK